VKNYRKTELTPLLLSITMKTVEYFY